MRINEGGARPKKDFNLERLSVDDLLNLRDRISEMLSSRVEAERRDLEARLARLCSVDVPDAVGRARGGRVIGKRAMVEAKYRNAENPSETWSGRGRQPRWLTTAIKAGKKLRDFEIGGEKPKKKRSGSPRKT